MVALNDFVGQFRQWLAVELENQAVRFEIGIHPIKRKTFLDVKFLVGVLVKNDFGEQSVDFHHRTLTADLNTRAVWVSLDIFARLELMILRPLLRIKHVILKSLSSV